MSRNGPLDYRIKTNSVHHRKPITIGNKNDLMNNDLLNTTANQSGLASTFGKTQTKTPVFHSK